MKLSFSTLGCPDWSWGDIIATASDMGYDGCEIRGVQRVLYAPDVPEFAPEAIEATKAYLQARRLQIPCLASDSVLHLRAYAERTTREVRAYIALAQRLGVPYIRVMGDNPEPQPGAPVDTGFVTESANRLGEEAAKAGVQLLLETNGWFADTERLARVLEKCPTVGALWDVHHPYRFCGESPETSWANIGRWVKHVHCKDSIIEDGKLRYRLLGYGDVPIEEIVQTLRANGYGGYYSLEWVKRWDLSLEEPGIAFAQYVAFMRSFA